MARVHSSNKVHRRTIARQTSARSKPARGGSLRKTFRRTSKKTNKVVTLHNPLPTGHDSAGRPIFAKKKMSIVTIEDWSGNKHRTTSRIAARLMGLGKIPFQELK